MFMLKVNEPYSFLTLLFSEKGMLIQIFFNYLRLMFYFLMSLSYTVFGNQKLTGHHFYCEMKLFKAERQHAPMFR